MKLISARQAIADSYGARLGVSWDVTGSAPPRPDNCGRIWDGILSGKVISVVERLPPQQRAWALWCYTDQGRPVHEMQILDWLCDEIDKAPPVSYESLGRMRRVVEVLHLLMLDARQRERNGLELYSAAALAERVGVDRKQFHKARYWGRFCECARRHIERLVADSLAPVANLVDDINRERAA